MCTNFVPIMNIHWNKMTDGEINERTRSVRLHFDFCVQLHQAQHDSGRCFLFGRTLLATFWEEPGAARLSAVRGAFKTRCHMCRFGMWRPDGTGGSFAHTPTGFFTNPATMAEEFNPASTMDHRHIKLEGMGRLHALRCTQKSSAEPYAQVFSNKRK